MFYNCPATYLNIEPAVQYFIILTWTEFSINPFQKNPPHLQLEFSLFPNLEWLVYETTTTTLIPVSQANTTCNLAPEITRQ